MCGPQTIFRNARRAAAEEQVLWQVGGSLPDGRGSVFG